MSENLRVGDAPAALVKAFDSPFGIDRSKPIVPFLKWAGGKRWLADHLREVMGPIEGTYIEPFLGGGAVFFTLLPKRALLADSNRELVSTYRAIQLQHRAVAGHLAEHQRQHSKQHYYRVRGSTPPTFAKRAARFIYLNRTCWNGLYRVNLNGIFNVPIGTKTTVVLDSDDFLKVSSILRSTTLLNADFQVSISQAGRGDVVFCDPPYTVRHNNNGFVKYNDDLFLWSDQIRLRDSLVQAKARGARVYITNANHQSIKELYSDGFRIREFERYSSIGGLRAIRGNYSELLITG